MSVQTPEEIYEYTDFRAFLKAHVSDVKSKNSQWSYGSWAKRLGLKGAASLTMVINGQREAGPKMSEQLVRYFGFRENERHYFLNLIQLSKASGDSRLAVLLMEELRNLHPSGKFRILDETSFSVIADWYHFAIREMVKLTDFKEDPAWISKKMTAKVSRRDVERAIDNMLSLNLLRRDAGGKLQVSDGRIDTRQDVASEAGKRHLEQMNDMGRDSIRLVDVSEREMASSTIVICEDDIEPAKKMIRQFRRRFGRQLDKAQGTAVYQMNIQFFPITRLPKKTSKSGD